MKRGRDLTRGLVLEEEVIGVLLCLSGATRARRGGGVEATNRLPHARALCLCVSLSARSLFLSICVLKAQNSSSSTSSQTRQIGARSRLCSRLPLKSILFNSRNPRQRPVSLSATLKENNNNNMSPEKTVYVVYYCEYMSVRPGRRATWGREREGRVRARAREREQPLRFVVVIRSSSSSFFVRSSSSSSVRRRHRSARCRRRPLVVVIAPPPPPQETSSHAYAPRPSRARPFR